MDMAFLRRAERLLAQDQPARIDHSILIATLAAQQQAQASVHRGRAGVAECAPCAEEPLIELLLGGPAWHQALAAQRGCFSRAEAGRRINAS